MACVVGAMDTLAQVRRLVIAARTVAQILRTVEVAVSWRLCSATDTIVEADNGRHIEAD